MKIFLLSDSFYTSYHNIRYLDKIFLENTEFSIINIETTSEHVWIDLNDICFRLKLTQKKKNGMLG